MLVSLFSCFFCFSRHNSVVHDPSISHISKKRRSSYHSKREEVFGKFPEFVDTFDYSASEYKNTSPWIPQLQRGKVIKVYDGDTITVASKCYEHSDVYRFTIRLRGVDSPEIKGKTDEERHHAIVARDALHKLIFGKTIIIKNCGKEKWGRVLADIYIEDIGKHIHINQWLLDNKYAVAYNGGKKCDWEFD